VGVVGVGVYFLDRVVQGLNFPCKTIAVETNVGRLHWCHAQDSILIDDHGPIPEIFNDTRRMVHGWRSEFTKLVSSLDVAFILTGLNGTSGKGVTSIVAETLGQLGVFTMAVLLGRREAEAIRSLGRVVDGVFEIPYEPFWDQARTPQGWQELLATEIAKVCRSASFSVARGSFKRTDVENPSRGESRNSLHHA
jgi:cell division GTPase FtsZ